MHTLHKPTTLRSDLAAAADLAPWLQQLNAELDGALADFAHTMTAVQNGDYAERASHQRFGLVEVNFSPNAAARAIERATADCVRSVIASFISFMDKLIASQTMMQEGILVDRNLATLEEIHEYLTAYVAKKVAAVAADNRLNNPKKLARFDGLSDFSKRAALGYFALRRCVEHHQSVAQEDIQLCALRQKLFIDDVEVTRLPARVSGGQHVSVRLEPEEKAFPADRRVVLSPEDVYGVVLTLLAVASEIFRLQVEQVQAVPT